MKGRTTARARRRAIPPLLFVSGSVALALGVWAHGTWTAASTRDPAYEFRPAAPERLGVFEASNPAHGFRASVSGASVRIAPASGRGFTLQLSPVERGISPSGRAVAPQPGMVALGDRLEVALSPALEGWYENGPRGLVQGFTLHRPPGEARRGGFASEDVGPARELAARSAPVLDIEIAGDVVAKLSEDARSIEFFDREGTLVAVYGAPTGAGADRAEWPVRLEPRPHEGGGGLSGFRLVLERVEGAYPLTIAATLMSAKRAHAPLRGLGAEAAAAWTISESAFAVAPPNDTCAGAEVVPPSGPFPYLTAVTADITDATTTGDPVAVPPCAFNAGPVSRSLWYAFTPATSGTYVISTCADAPTGSTVDDTVLAVYTSAGGCAGPFTQVPGACDDDSCSFEFLQSVVTTPLTAGTPYSIVVWLYGTAAPAQGHTAVQLRIDRLPPPMPPANDLCEGAEAIPGAGPFPHLTSVVADITDATIAGDPASPPSCQTNVSRSVWYTFTPAVSGSYLLSTCAGDFGGTATTVDDTVLSVYTSTGGCFGPFTEVPTSGTRDGCDDDTCGDEALQAVLSTVLDAGTTYYILAHKFGAAAPTPGNTALQLRVEALPSPSNDTCASAIPLVLDRPLAGSTRGASDDYRSPSDATCFAGAGQVASSAPGRDVVYRFTAPGTGPGLYSFRVTNFTGDPVLVAASDCPSAPPSATVACLSGANRTFPRHSEQVKCLPITGGETVSLFVDEHALTPGSPFTIEATRCVSETEPNDTPATANPRTCGLEGGILFLGDVDFYALGSPPAGHRAFALVDGIAANSDDLDLRVTTTASTLEYDDLNLDVPFGSLAPTVAGTPLPGDASFLRVSHFSTLGLADPYRLYAVVQPPIGSAVAEIEPNDALGQANVAASGYFLGTLAGPAPSTDVDLFGFDAAEGEIVHLGLDADPLRDATPINAALALLDAAGNTLLAVNDPGATSSTTAGTNSLAATTPNSPAEGLVWRARYTGRHYARVSIPTSATGPSGAGDYLLSIALDCLPTDLDGDGVPNREDCAPSDPSAFALPGVVVGLRAGPAKDQLTWTPATGGPGTSHDVLRGRLDALPVGPGDGDEVCFDGVIPASHSDPTLPAAGTGFWYLVRGDNACGKGSWGRRGDRGVAGVERTTSTCP